MTDVKVYPDKHLTYWFVPDGGLADPEAPTAADINAGINLSQAVAWDSTEVNPDDSSDIDDAGITDAATAVEPGFDQYSAVINMFYPKDMSLTTDPYVVAYNVFAPGRVLGYLVRRFKPADVNTDTSMQPAAAGDWVEVFRVMADFTAQDTEGEDSTKYTVNFLPQGFMSGIVMVGGADAVEIDPGSLALSVGDVGVLTAAIDGQNVTQDVEWSSDDPVVATVSSGGVVTALDAGTANITASYASSTASDTAVVTVS